MRESVKIKLKQNSKRPEWTQFLKNSKIRIAFLVLLLVLVAGEILILRSSAQQRGAIREVSEAELDRLAEEVVSTCSEAAYRPACYDEEIPKLMDFISMEDAFRVTALVQDRDDTYQYCHVLGHNLSAREVQKDFDKWNDILPRCPVGLCANGCLHGAFQERFRAEALTDPEIEDIKPELAIACESRAGRILTGLEEATCWHGLGHVAMIMTGGEVERSIKLCEEVALTPDRRDFRSLCFEGLFMQLFQPLEPEDFALVEGKQPVKEELFEYCAKFSTQLIDESCWGQGWALYREEIATPAGLNEFCNTPKVSSSREKCFYMIFHVVGQNNNFDSAKIEKFCASADLPFERRGMCFTNAASSIIQADKRFVDKVINLCDTAVALGLGDACHRGLAEFAAYNLPQGSAEFNQLCAGLPETLRDVCLARG